MSDNWEQRMKAEGRCIKCGAKRAPDSSNFCARHRDMHRERNRLSAKRKSLDNKIFSEAVTDVILIILCIILVFLIFSKTDKELLSFLFISFLVFLGINLKHSRGEP